MNQSRFLRGNGSRWPLRHSRHRSARRSSSSKEPVHRIRLDQLNGSRVPNEPNLPRAGEACATLSANVAETTPPQKFGVEDGQSSSRKFLRPTLSGVG